MTVVWNKAQRRISKCPTDVYRVFDGRGRLLYVGVSVDVFIRMREHRRYSLWWHQAARATVTTYPDRASARWVESVAIRDESPVFNVVREIPLSAPDGVSRPCHSYRLRWDEGGVSLDAA